MANLNVSWSCLNSTLNANDRRCVPASSYRNIKRRLPIMSVIKTAKSLNMKLLKPTLRAHRGRERLLGGAKPR